MKTYLVRVVFETEIEAADEEEASEIAMRAANENGFQVTCEEKIPEHEHLHTDIDYDESIMKRLKSER